MNKRIGIRPAAPGDEPGLAKVHIRSWQETYKGLIAQTYLDALTSQLDERVERWRKTLNQPQRWVWVADGPDGVLGFALFAPPRDDGKDGFVEIGAIYLLAAEKAKGIGFMLLRRGFEQMKKLGYKRAYCWVLAGNPTIKFYERTGAQVSGQTKQDEIGGEKLTELCYEWPSLDLEPATKVDQSDFKGSSAKAELLKLMSMKNRRHRLIFFAMFLFVALVALNQIDVSVSNSEASIGGTSSSAAHESQIFSESKPGEVSLAESKKNLLIEPRNEQLSPLEQETKELLCKLRHTRTRIPMQGEVQVFVTRKTLDFDKSAKNIAWVKSESCPIGTHSIVHFNDDGEVFREIDCRFSSLTEIAALSGEQANIVPTPPGENEKNLAVSGPGYFVLSCPNGRLLLTRDGQFQKELEGQLANKDGCTLLSQAGEPLLDSAIDHTGCTSAGACVALIDPSMDDVDGLEHIGNQSFYVEDFVQPKESVTKVGSKASRPWILVDALEDVYNPARGPAGVAWINHPHVDINRINCDNGESK